jgi:hypothetical protein
MLSTHRPGSPGWCPRAYFCGISQDLRCEGSQGTYSLLQGRVHHPESIVRPSKTLNLTMNAGRSSASRPGTRGNGPYTADIGAGRPQALTSPVRMGPEDLAEVWIVLIPVAPLARIHGARIVGQHRHRASSNPPSALPGILYLAQNLRFATHQRGISRTTSTPSPSLVPTITPFHETLHGPSHAVSGSRRFGKACATPLRPWRTLRTAQALFGTSHSHFLSVARRLTANGYGYLLEAPILKLQASSR